MAKISLINSLKLSSGAYKKNESIYLFSMNYDRNSLIFNFISKKMQFYIPIWKIKLAFHFQPHSPFKNKTITEQLKIKGTAWFLHNAVTAQFYI